MLLIYMLSFYLIPTVPRKENLTCLSGGRDTEIPEKMRAPLHLSLLRCSSWAREWPSGRESEVFARNAKNLSLGRIASIFFQSNVLAPLTTL